jgi:uncharacterized protein
MNITVVYSPAPRKVHEVALNLPAGAVVADAIVQVRALEAFDQIDWGQTRMGIWNHKASLEQALHDKDRLEIYRPLRVDPKVARRERFAKQGARTSGLFAKRRPGGKAGY